MVSKSDALWWKKTFNGSLRFANKDKVLMPTTTKKNEEIRLPFAQNKNRHLRLSSSQSQHLLVRKFQRIQLMATLGKVSLAVSVYFSLFGIVLTKVLLFNT